MRRTPSGDTYRIATAHAAQQIKSPSREYFRLPPSPLGAPGSLLRSERLARVSSSMWPITLSGSYALTPGKHAGGRRAHATTFAGGDNGGAVSAPGPLTRKGAHV
jgi:hypothetical protein